MSMCITTIGAGKMCVMGEEEPKRKNETSTKEEFNRYLQLKIRNITMYLFRNWTKALEKSNEMT